MARDAVANHSMSPPPQKKIFKGKWSSSACPPLITPVRKTLYLRMYQCVSVGVYMYVAIYHPCALHTRIYNPIGTVKIIKLAHMLTLLSQYMYVRWATLCTSTNGLSSQRGTQEWTKSCVQPPYAESEKGSARSKNAINHDFCTPCLFATPTEATQLCIKTAHAQALYW